MSAGRGAPCARGMSRCYPLPALAAARPPGGWSRSGRRGASRRGRRGRQSPSPLPWLAAGAAAVLPLAAAQPGRPRKASRVRGRSAARGRQCERDAGLRAGGGGGSGPAGPGRAHPYVRRRVAASPCVALAGPALALGAAQSVVVRRAGKARVCVYV